MLRDRGRERRQRGIGPPCVCERMREGVGHARPDLEQRQVDRAETGADGVFLPGRVVAQHPLEIAEIFRDAVLKEGGGARLGFLPLVLEIKAGRDRVMGVVNLGHEIGDGELEPMGEQAPRLVLRRKLKLRPEIVKDIGDMGDDDFAVAQEWRGERGLRRAALEHRRHRFHAASGSAFARDIDIRRAGRLEGEADKLAPPLNARPVEQLVGHRLIPRLRL